MKAQFKYALRSGLSLRAAAFAIMALINLPFGLLGYLGFLGYGAMVVAVILSSLAFCGVFAVNIIADVGSLKFIFGTPHGYLHALTPVKSWKTLLARTAAIVIEDSIAICAGVLGIAWQSLNLADEAIGISTLNISVSGYDSFFSALAGIGVSLILYAYVLMLVVFGVTLKQSVFAGLRGKSVLALLCVAAAVWVLSLADFLLVPFGALTNWGMFFYIELPGGFGAGSMVYVILLMARVSALFAASAAMIERKIELS
jgi:hypothetical protein